MNKSKNKNIINNAMLSYGVAKARFVHIAPRKLRILAKLIARKNVAFAERELAAHPKRSAISLLKLLRSAKANAAHNAKISSNTPLFIKAIYVDGGRVLKRFMPRAFGRAAPIHKRTSHITLILSPIADRKSPIDKRSTFRTKQ